MIYALTGDDDLEKSCKLEDRSGFISQVREKFFSHSSFIQTKPKQLNFLLPQL